MLARTTAGHRRFWRLLKNKRPTWCHLLFYFTSYVLNMFQTLIYPSSEACDYSVELSHWSYCSWFVGCWSFGVVGLEWYPCCRLKPATRIPLQPKNFWDFSIKYGTINFRGETDSKIRGECRLPVRHSSIWQVSYWAGTTEENLSAKPHNLMQMSHR